MAGGSIAKLYAEVGVDIDKLQAGLEEASRGLAALSKEFAKTKLEPEVKTDKSREGLNNLVDGLGKFNWAVEGAKKIVGIFTETMEKAFDFGKEGATILQLNASFEQLMGTEEKAMEAEAKLRAAVHGTMTGEQMQAAVLRMLTGATGVFADRIKETAPQLFEMAGAAAKLNPTLGDTQTMLAGLAQSLEYGTARGLKRMGIIVDQAAAEEKLAQSLGKTKDSLSEEEQKLALLNAALEYHDTLMQQVGGTTESLVDPYKRLETAVEETTDKFKILVAQGVTPAAEALALLLTWDDKVAAAQQEHAQDVLRTSESFSEYANEMLRARLVGSGFVLTEEQQSQILEDLKNNVEETAKGWDIATQAQWEAEKATEKNNQTMADAALGMRDYGYNTGLTTDEIKELGKALEKEQQIQQAAYQDQIDFSKQLASSGKDWGKYQEETAEADKEIAKLEKENQKLFALQGKVRPLSMKELEQVYVKLADAMDAAKRGQAGANEEVAKFDAIIKGTAPKQYYDFTATIDANKAKIAELQTKEQERYSALIIQSKEAVASMLAERFALGGWTQEEVAAYTNAAVSMGLMTTAQANQAAALANLNVQYDTGKISASEYAKQLQNIGLQTDTVTTKSQDLGGELPKRIERLTPDADDLANSMKRIVDSTGGAAYVMGGPNGLLTDVETLQKYAGNSPSNIADPMEETGFRIRNAFAEAGGAVGGVAGGIDDIRSKDNTVVNIKVVTHHIDYYEEKEGVPPAGGAPEPGGGGGGGPPTGGGGGRKAYQSGGLVRKAGAYRLHPEEGVLNPSMRSGTRPLPSWAFEPGGWEALQEQVGGGVNIGPINVYAAPGMNPHDVALAVKTELAAMWRASRHSGAGVMGT